MFDFFKGIVVSNKSPYLVLDVEGVGYKLEVTNNTLVNTSLGEDIIIYTEFSASDKGIYLYGFLSEEERDLFQLLKSVNNIGGKTALSIVGSMTPKELVYAIRTEDKELLKKAQGIGDKSAVRIILELKDKVKDFDVHDIVTSIDSIKNEVFEAMESLGYTRYELQKRLNDASFENMDINKALKEALKLMNS